MVFFKKGSNRNRNVNTERKQVYHPEKVGGNFRFPLVDDGFTSEPDQESSPYALPPDSPRPVTVREPKSERRRQMKKEMPIARHSKRLGRDVEKSSPSVERRFFTPTDVPKPIAIYETLQEAKSAAKSSAKDSLPTNVPHLVVENQELGALVVEEEEAKCASVMDSSNEWVEVEVPVPTSDVAAEVSSSEEELESIETVEKEGASTFEEIMRQREEKRNQPEPPMVTASVARCDYRDYHLPSQDFLQPRAVLKVDEEWIERQAETLDETLYQFGVQAKVVHYSQGPTVTRFEIQPEPGVKVSKITNLSDDLKLSLAAKDIRIEAPIPGKPMVGIEIPNRRSRPVFIREILEEKAFLESSSPLTVAMGLDISGKPITTDLRKMPHGLVAGSTGSGKSVFINSLLVSLLYKASPEDLRLMLIDPKMVELSCYNGIPHLVAPVITDPKVATAGLKWAVEEMERRYEAFVRLGVRDITSFNEKIRRAGDVEEKMPYLVIVIDELADLMMTSPTDVEESICRIAQKARACGIHLIVATQRPSVDVITGLIKANIPTRIAFSVSAQIDSRTILDQGGAERLLGRGDMLFLENGTSKAVRLQGTYVNDEEIENVVRFVGEQMSVDYLFSPEAYAKGSGGSGATNGSGEGLDSLFMEACELAVEMGSASTSLLQRRLRIGYNRAARIVDLMEEYGVVPKANGTKARNVLISYDDLEMLRELTEMN